MKNRDTGETQQKENIIFSVTTLSLYLTLWKSLWDAAAYSRHNCQFIFAVIRFISSQPEVTSDAAKHLNDQKNTHIFILCRTRPKVTFSVHELSRLLS